VLITRVLHVKTRDGVQMVTCNGSISMVPLTHYCPQILRAFTRQLEPRRGPLVSSVIYGATCRENDILYEGAFVEVGSGDYLVHYASGAYNASLTPAFIFDAPGLECI
jgi:diaminopimelate decarboxylase